jgi:hypothetical protein
VLKHGLYSVAALAPGAHDPFLRLSVLKHYHSLPKCQMRFAGRALSSINLQCSGQPTTEISYFLDLEGYLRKLALRATWPSFGNNTVRRNSIAFES